jgi:hypothetical protein
MSIPEPLQFNGADTRQNLGRSNGQPTPWHCVNCARDGKGVMSQAAHWRDTQHMCRFGKRPMTSVCAWCDPKRETAERLIAQGHTITHGICSTHKAEFEAGR